MTGRRLTITPACDAVLRAAMVKGPAGDHPKEALQKCSIHGWIQFEGDDGETLALTGEGRKACEKVGIK